MLRPSVEQDRPCYAAVTSIPRNTGVGGCFNHKADFSAGVCVGHRSVGASAHSNCSETKTVGGSSQKMFPPFQRLSKENTISPILLLQSLAVKGLAAHLLAGCYVK